MVKTLFDTLKWCDALTRSGSDSPDISHVPVCTAGIKLPEQEAAAARGCIQTCQAGSQQQTRQSSDIVGQEDMKPTKKLNCADCAERIRMAVDDVILHQFCL